MTIGFDFRMGGSINAGIGRYVFELLKEILKLDKENQYIVFYNVNNVDAADLKILKTHTNVTLVCTTSRHYSISEQFFFLRLLNRYKLDLVHFPNFNVPVFYKRPFVVTIHDMVHHKLGGHKKSTLIFFYGYKYVINKAAQQARRIITVTEAAKKDIVNMLGVPAEKVEVIYEAPFLQASNPELIEKVKQQFLLRRPYFLFVGTLERKKNVPALTKGFDVFLDKYKMDMDLVIAGKQDKHYPQVKFQAMDIKHADRLVFTDFVEDKVLSALYQGAYAFATASTNEGFGLPGVEAMRMGLPVLAANDDVLNEVYDNGAIYFDAFNPEDIADKMALLAQDLQFYKQVQERGMARAQMFDWELTARKTLDLYNSVV
jgi:glycosyltransferase involved in cell wall biosynthesis